MNADTIIICPSSYFSLFCFFRVSEIRLPAALLLSLVWTALFHTSSQFGLETSGVIVTSFSRLLRVSSESYRESRSEHMHCMKMFQGASSPP
jgi:hypothetical protein